MERRITFSMLERQKHNGIVNSVEDIKKILFSASTGNVLKNDVIGIDIENKALYYNMESIEMGRVEPTKILKDEEIDMLKDMIVYFKIKDWKQFYSDPNADEIMDGHGWALFLEGNDGIIEVHRGFGTKKSLVTPNGFNEFEKILHELAKYE